MQWISGVVAAAVLWLLLYNNLEWLASHLLQIAGISRINRLGEALFFFIYEVPKVLLLLSLANQFETFLPKPSKS